MFPGGAPESQPLPGMGAPPPPGPQGQPFPSALPASMPMQAPEQASEFKLPKAKPIMRPEVAGPKMQPIYDGILDDEYEREKLGRELVENANAWIAYISALWPRWQTNERLMINQTENPKELPWDGAVYRHIPVTSSKINGWLSFVCQPPTSTSPYLTTTIFGKDANRAKTVEHDIYQFMRRGEWSKTFRVVTYETAVYGKGIWRVYLDHDPFGLPYFHFEDISPRAWVMYPNTQDMLDATMIGHIYELSIEEIDRMQESGEFYSGFEVQGSSEFQELPEAGRLDNKNDIARDKSRRARLVECFIKRAFGDDKEPKWYLARFSLDDPHLLGVYKYPYSVPWYFDQFVHQEPQRFWPETSRANDLQALQLATNDSFNQTAWSQQMAWDPAIFTIGWNMDKKYSKLKPGSMTPALQGGSVSQVQVQAHVGEGIMMINTLSEMADRSIRFGDQQLGADVPSGTKATVADIQQRSASFAAADDLAIIDICMGKLGRFLQELYRKHYKDFEDAYGDNLSTRPDDGTDQRGYPAILGRPIEWELLGKSPANSPMAQTQAIQGLAQAIVPLVNPEVLMGMQAAGLNSAELIQALVMNSQLNDRDVILMNMDEGQRAQSMQAFIQQHQQQQAMQAQAKQRNPQMEQAKMQIEGQKIALDQAKAQGDQRMQMLKLIEAIYADAPPDVKREIEARLGLEPSHIHPVVSQALGSGDLHQALLNPPALPATNGKPKGGLMGGADA